MKYPISYFLILIFLFSTIDGFCLIFHHHGSNSSINNCELNHFTNESYKMCLRCYIYQQMTSLDNITIENNCSPISNLYCVDFYFNDTKSFQIFTLRYSDLINNLFDGSNRTIVLEQNTLNINIEYDTLDKLSFETFKSLDIVKNRNYERLHLELKNRNDQLTLSLEPDIVNMTLLCLQISIYCGWKGLHLYSYVPMTKKELIKALKCEVPTEIFTTKIIPLSTVFLPTVVTSNQHSSSSTILTNKKKYKYVILVSVIGGASLVPCVLFACCLYILCVRNDERNDERRASIAPTVSESDSISSEESEF